MDNPGQGGSGVQQPGHAAQVNVASIEEIMRKTKEMCKFPNVLPDPPPDDSPVRTFCVSRLRSNWVTKINPLSSILREYVSTLESTKRFSHQELLGSQINLTKNTISLRGQCENTYRSFLQEINNLDDADTGSLDADIGKPQYNTFINTRINIFKDLALFSYLRIDIYLQYETIKESNIITWSDDKLLGLY